MTASEKDVSDPQWSPDGRRLAYVRDDEIRIVDADGSRRTSRSTGHPAGVIGAALVARWPPARVHLAAPRLVAGLGRRRARPAPRPAGPRPEPPEPRALTADRLRRRGLRAGRADGRSHRRQRPRDPDHAVAEIHLVDVASGDERRVAGGGKEWASGPRAVPDGGLLYVSDADGWFQVVRLSADGRDGPS